MAGPWEKYGTQQSQGGQPWAKYGGGAASAASAPPPMPAAPIPQGLQGPPAQGPSTLRDLVVGAGKGLLSSGAQAINTSLAPTMWGIHQGEQESGIAPYLQGPESNAIRTPEPQGLAQQAGYYGEKGGEMIAGAATALPRKAVSTGIETVGKYAPEFVPTHLGRMVARPLIRRGTQTLADMVRGGAEAGAPKQGAEVGAELMSTPRPSLIEQMGGRPVEDISDQALKQQMENSPEFSYSQYAKRHAGSASRSYPEPNPNDPYWREQSPNRAPWGGNFSRQ